MIKKKPEQKKQEPAGPEIPLRFVGNTRKLQYWFMGEWVDVQQVGEEG